MSSKSTAVKAQDAKEVAPSYIKSGGNRGSESVTTEDITIPRIEVMQALSPCLDKKKPEYIEGGEQGHLYNSVTRQDYGEHIIVVPVLFRSQFLVWRERKLGGGFRGAYDTAEEAREAAAGTEDPQNWAIIPTAQNLVLVVHADGTTEEAMISMAKTKLKVSRQWNALVRINGGDRFSRAYNVFSVDDANSQGQDYKNLGVANAGFPSEANYLQAEALYEQVTAGLREVKMDTSDTGEGDAKVEY
jgi:hypothetical protein